MVRVLRFNGLEVSSPYTPSIAGSLVYTETASNFSNQVTRTVTVTVDGELPIWVDSALWVDNVVWSE